VRVEVVGAAPGHGVADGGGRLAAWPVVSENGKASDRAIVAEMLAMKDSIDLVVPRGGEELIRFVEKNATMPVLIGGIGVCHTYVDRDADFAKAQTESLQKQATEVAAAVQKAMSDATGKSSQIS